MRFTPGARGRDVSLRNAPDVVVVVACDATAGEVENEVVLANGGQP